jgi:environmental stress-induced protein Ves
MPITHLPASTRIPQPWRNGGGVTREVARCAAPPGAAREFLWRVSIANVAAAGPFSSFAGYARSIAVIEGPGMILRDAAAGDVELRPYDVHRFDGSAAVEGLLPRGPVSDLNLIHDPRRCVARLAIVDRLPGRAAAPEWLVINLGDEGIDWRCGAHAGTLAHLDTLRIEATENEVEWRGVRRAALIEIAPA